MKTNKLIARVLLAFVALSVPACTGTLCKLPAERTGIDVMTGAWRIVSVRGEEVAKTLPEGAQEQTLTINDDGSIAGFAGVNRVSGRVDAKKLAQGVWEAGPMVSTKMAGPPELMALEREIMLVLESADAIVHTGGSVVLTIEGEEGLALMRGE